MICPAMDTKSPLPCCAAACHAQYTSQKHLAALVSATFSLYLQSLGGFAPFDSKEQNVEHNRFARCDCRRALAMGIIVGREK